MKRALYFGYGSGGHFLRFPDGGRSTLDPAKAGSNFPWSIHHLDTGLLENRGVPDRPDGRVHWTCGGAPVFWFAFVWWDRSGDSRGASNSGFYVEGFDLEEVGSDRSSVSSPELIKKAREAFLFAQGAWPDVVRRQAFPLVLQSAP